MPTPNQSHLHRVARALKCELDSTERNWITVDRWKVTDMLRDTSGEENTRLKAGLGRRLDHELLEQGVRTFPTFEETTTEDSLRLFKIGKLEARLIEILTKPSQSTDKRLTRLTNQTKLGGRFIRIVKEVEKL